MPDLARPADYWPRQYTIYDILRLDCDQGRRLFGDCVSSDKLLNAIKRFRCEIALDMRPRRRVGAVILDLFRWLRPPFWLTVNRPLRAPTRNALKGCFASS